MSKYLHEQMKSAAKEVCGCIILTTPKERTKEAEFLLSSMLDTLIWKVSEAGPFDCGDKYTRCEWWSADAQKSYASDGTDGLRFEHVVPKAYIVNRLVAATIGADIDAALALIVSCVVIKDEADRLTEWDRTHPEQRFTNAESGWERYVGSKISPWTHVTNGWWRE